ncbi:hypothetical protein GBAR_LOCUS16988 [Geodia barretti]|uniref:Uncharacterized protein n=1 Tax=Geodia barretti TaxID=519541 RepID=A0AA35SH05_GEOBA|nr:hypothetical protein GBAR_LOCUS16988 [Geodia barretti]
MVRHCPCSRGEDTGCIYSTVVSPPVYCSNTNTPTYKSSPKKISDKWGAWVGIIAFHTFISIPKQSFLLVGQCA